MSLFARVSNVLNRAHSAEFDASELNLAMILGKSCANECGNLRCERVGFNSERRVFASVLLFGGGVVGVGLVCGGKRFCLLLLLLGL